MTSLKPFYDENHFTSKQTEHKLKEIPPNVFGGNKEKLKGNHVGESWKLINWNMIFLF
jgi:hypothetical protein